MSYQDIKLYYLQTTAIRRKYSVNTYMRFGLARNPGPAHTGATGKTPPRNCSPPQAPLPPSQQHILTLEVTTTTPQLPRHALSSYVYSPLSPLLSPLQGGRGAEASHVKALSGPTNISAQKRSPGAQLDEKQFTCVGRLT